MLTLSLLDFDVQKTIEKIKDFIASEVKRSGLKGAIVAVSGGIDSAVTLGLTSLALGSENVHSITMPERDITPSSDITGVMHLTSQYNVTCDVVEITSVVDVLSELLPLYDKSHRISVGNLKPRIRMIISYYYANEMNRMVIGSSNKTELMTGYFTKYGDGASDLMPIADLYKFQVRKIANHLNIPKEIIEKIPPAGLWPGQTDEKELGIDYNTLDLVVHGYDLKFDSKKISEQLQIEVSLVEDIINRIQRNEHKRRSPLILRLSS